MKKDLETVVHTKQQTSVTVDKWDDGVWLHIMVRGGSAMTVLTKEEAQELMRGLQAVLDAEVTA